MKPTPDAPPSSHIRVRLLGGFRAERDGEPIKELDKGRTRALLTYLILHRDAPVSRQQLAYALWPNTSDKQARGNLRTLLFRLRRALVEPDRFFTMMGQTLHWRADAPLSTDLIELEQAMAQAEGSADNDASDDDRQLQLKVLDQAVTLYRGDLLPTCYDDWIGPKRERLREAYLHALETLILLHEDQRAYNAAITHAQRLLRTDPLHEATHRRLMRLHALNGDRAGALRAYHACADILQRELDVEPGPKTQEAYARILRRDAEVAALPEATRGRAQMVGRNKEWSSLIGAWRAANAGKPCMVAITGEAGIGKTRLAEEMLAWAERQGSAMAVARCYAADDDLSYGPVIQWLQTELIREQWSDMDDLWLAELARVIPQLLTDRPKMEIPDPLNARWQRQRILEAMARALLASGRPLLLLIDDLQWSDAETLNWLHYLLQFSLLQYDAQTPLLILATVRLEEMADGHRYESLRLALGRSGHLSELPLAPLNEEETATLANALSDQGLTAEQSNALFHNTEGNPLFVVETMQAGEEIEDSGLKIGASDQSSILNLQSLPPKVAAVLQQRLAQLSPPARQLMQLAAVIGRAFTLDMLAQLCEQDEDALVDALDEAWRRRIIREQGVNAYDFSHDKLRTVAYAQTSPARRRHLHKRIAVILAAQGGERTDDACIQIAQHFLQAGDQVQAAHYYRRAAEVASRRYAIEGMLSASTMALTLFKELDPGMADRAGLYTRAAIIDERIWGWEMVGDMDAYLRDLTMLKEIGTALEDGDLLKRVDRRRAAALIRLGRYREAEEMALANAARHKAAGAPEDEGICLTIVGRARRESGAYDEAIAAFEQALALLDMSESFVYQIQAYSYLSTTRWLMGDYEQALLCGEQALAICDRESMHERRRFALGDMGAAAAMLGRETQARQWLEESLKLARQLTDTTQEAFCRGHLGWLDLHSGDAEEAERELQTAYELSQSADLTNYASWLLRGLAETATAQGRPEQACAHAAEALAIAQANHQGAEERAAQRLIVRLQD